MGEQDHKLFVTTYGSFGESFMGKTRSFSKLLSWEKGWEFLTSFHGLWRVFTLRQHTCASLLGAGESCWVATSASQLFWGNWSLPTDLLSCCMCLLPSFLELLQLFLEGDPVERGGYGPGTAGIFNDLSAADSKVPTPWGNPGGRERLWGNADYAISWKPLLKFGDIAVERLAGWKRTWGRHPLWGWPEGKQIRSCGRLPGWAVGEKILGPGNCRLLISWSEQSIVMSIVICLQIAHLVSLRKSWPHDSDCLIWRLWIMITFCLSPVTVVTPRSFISGFQNGTKDPAS